MALVPELPATSSVNTDSGDESFVLIWAGMIPQRHEEVCEVLESASIPARTIHRDDHIFGTSLQSTFSVYVPTSLAAKAKALLMETGAPGVDEGGSLDATDTDEPEINELPAEDDFPEDDGNRQERSNVNPEDATVEIWSGEDGDLAEMIIACFRENQIYCRSNHHANEDEEASDAENPPKEIEPEKLFVLLEDESRARDILHEIIEAAPPE